MPIGKEVGLPLDFQFLLFMKAGQVGVFSINSSVGVAVPYPSNNLLIAMYNGDNYEN